MGYLLSLLFFITLSPRLTVFIDILDLDIPERILNKILWIWVYILVLAAAGLICYFRCVNVKKVVLELVAKYRLAFISVALFVLGVGVSTIFSLNGNESLMGFGYYLVVISILPFSLFIFEVFPTVRKSIMKGMFVSAVILIIIAIAQFIDYRVNQNLGGFVTLFNPSGLATVESFNVRTSDIGLFLRPSSLMVDTNVFAVFLAVTILLVVDVWRRNRNKLVALIGVLSFVTLIITFSRTGIMVFLVGLIGYYVLNRVYSKDSAGKIYSITPLEIIVSRLGLDDYSAMEHLNYWIQSIKIFVKYPLYGIGAGNFPYYYNQYIDSKIAFATPHSVYAKLLSETGLIGFLPFVLMMLSFARALLLNRNAVFSALFIALLVGNITYDFLLTPWVWILLGLFVVQDGKIS